MMIVYGIKNCDTVQKTIKWLSQNKIEFQFRDYKVAGIDEKKLKAWCKELGWEKLLNKKSTTWRELDKATQLKTINEQAAIALMKASTSCIKRPVIEINGKAITVGFNVEEYERLAGSNFKMLIRKDT